MSVSEEATLKTASFTTGGETGDSRRTSISVESWPQKEPQEEKLPLSVNDWPKGTTLPLNSKQLNLYKCRSIAVAFELPSDVTLTET